MEEKKILQEILPEALEINQMLQDFPQSARNGAVELIKILARNVHGHSDDEDA